jgi:hypothetical protein
VHRHRRRNRAATRDEDAQRVGVIDGVHVDAREEGRRVGVGSGGSERSRHEGHIPADVRQRATQIPRHVRRAAARKEQPMGSETTTGTVLALSHGGRESRDAAAGHCCIVGGRGGW